MFQRRTRGVRTVLARIGQLVVTVLGVLMMTFLLVHLVPGDPALSILGTRATPETLTALRQELHLEDPLGSQLMHHLASVAQGDLGNSLIQPGRTVLEVVVTGLRVTLMLTAVTVILSVLVGVSAGLLAGASRRPSVDVFSRTAATSLLATPPFLVGFVLLLAVSGAPHLAPIGDWVGGLDQALLHLWLPGVALSFFLTPIIFRAVRQSARDVMGEEFVEAAVVRGYSPARVVVRHVLPNSLLPVIAVLGVNIGGLLGGAIVVEIVFNLPGVGRTLIQAVETRDYPVVQGVAICTALLVVTVSGASELLGRLLDPRVREER